MFGQNPDMLEQDENSKIDKLVELAIERKQELWASIYLIFVEDIEVGFKKLKKLDYNLKVVDII